MRQGSHSIPSTIQSPCVDIIYWLISWRNLSSWCIGLVCSIKLRSTGLGRNGHAPSTPSRLQGPDLPAAYTRAWCDLSLLTSCQPPRCLMHRQHSDTSQPPDGWVTDNLFTSSQSQILFGFPQDTGHYSLCWKYRSMACLRGVYIVKGGDIK